MRNLLVLLAVAGSLTAGTAPAPGNGPLIPRKADEFVFNNVDGLRLLTQVQQEYAAKGVQIPGAVFDQGAKGRVQQFHKELGLNFPVGYSEQGPVLEFLKLPPKDPYFVPILVFIDKRGMVRSQYAGDETFLSHQEVNIRAEIDKMLNAGAPAATAPKP